jgi:hypothetical protein
MSNIGGEAKEVLGWCIMELMGHRRLAGYVTEQEIAGSGFIRIDVPAEGEEVAAVQFYAPASVYAITPTTEDVARKVAAQSRPAPVSRWELPAAQAAEPATPKEGGDDGPF